jgi:hypothetical protein
MGPFVFRGQSNQRWPLLTSLEREADQYSVSRIQLWEEEKYILAEFKSRAHHYIQSPPGDNETLEWLALIRHYGGVSRLLGFTDSFYISAFFALETATPTENASIWAINSATLSSNYIKKFGSDIDSSKSYPYNLKPHINRAESYVNEQLTDNFILRVKPFRLNERMTVQQGVFLMPCSLENTFEKNLCVALHLNLDTLTGTAEPIALQDVDRIYHSIRVMKIILPRDERAKAISDLYSMGISAASLYPGLDGFARSLNTHLRVIGRPDRTSTNSKPT